MENNIIIDSYTLSRGNYFIWAYDGERILIKKEFKNKKQYKFIFTNDEVDKILLYIKGKERSSLSNSVSKLKDGTEKDGIGKYIYDNINKNTTVAQVASQLVSIFYSADILYYNNKKSGMEFWIKDINWKEKILDYISKQSIK